MKIITIAIVLLLVLGGYCAYELITGYDDYKLEKQSQEIPEGCIGVQDLETGEVDCFNFPG